MDIVKALRWSLTFMAEIAIKQIIRPDVAVVFLNRYLVGVVEIKKPAHNVLLQPTVLIIDQTCRATC